MWIKVLGQAPTVGASRYNSGAAPSAAVRMAKDAETFFLFGNSQFLFFSKMNNEIMRIKS